MYLLLTEDSKQNICFLLKIAIMYLLATEDNIGFLKFNVTKQLGEKQYPKLHFIFQCMCVCIFHFKDCKTVFHLSMIYSLYSQFNPHVTSLEYILSPPRLCHNSV